MSFSSPRIHRGDPDNPLIEPTPAFDPENPVSDGAATLGTPVQGLPEVEGEIARLVVPRRL